MANLKLRVFEKKEVEIKNEFDFLVVRYFWSEKDGSDLDTATGFIDTNIPEINEKSVGYKQTGSVNNLGENNPFLSWASDNINSGFESVLIQPKNLYDKYTNLDDEIKLLLTATWYRIRLNGNVKFSLTAYLGGTMSVSNYNYINTGGVEVFNQEFNKNITSKDKTSLLDTNFKNHTGNKLGEIIFKNSTKTARLILI